MSKNAVNPSKWLEKEDILTELDKRSADYKNGVVKGILWEDAKEQILASRKCKKTPKENMPR